MVIVPACWEIQVQYPLSATIHLASECTFAQTNPCHVRGIGYHDSDTRVWGDMLDSVVCDDTHDVLNLREHKFSRVVDSCCYTSLTLCVRNTESAVSG